MTITVKPARPELMIRDPKDKQVLPVEGKQVEKTSFWVRRMNDGDVVLVEDKPEAVAPAKKV